MAIGSIVKGVTSLFAGKEQAKAYEGASGLMAQAMGESVAFQKEMYKDTRNDLAPYRELGQNALTELGALYGMGRQGILSQDEIKAAYDRFQASPSYQFRYDQGLKAMDRSAAARGNLRGGGYMQELQRYGQGMASTEFDSYANRLATLAGVGQNATNVGAQAGAQTAAGVSNALLSGANSQANFMAGAGTARASGYAGLGNAAQQGVNNFLLRDILMNGGF